MHNPAQQSQPLLPRHYYQVALDFGRLSKRISASCHGAGHAAQIKVRNPATVLSDWETAFQNYTRPLAKFFHQLSTKVLGQSHGIKHLDTVCALVPLEQQVYGLLTLRKMVQNHKFPQRWQRGQYLFLARIDKILSDLQEILTYFRHITKKPQQPGSPEKRYLWEKEIECKAQTTAYQNWCHAKGCMASHLYLSQQGLGFLHGHCLDLWKKISVKIALHKRCVPLCNP